MPRRAIPPFIADPKFCPQRCIIRHDFILGAPAPELVQGPPGLRLLIAVLPENPSVCVVPRDFHRGERGRQEHVIFPFDAYPVPLDRGASLLPLEDLAQAKAHRQRALAGPKAPTSRCLRGRSPWGDGRAL